MVESTTVRPAVARLTASDDKPSEEPAAPAGPVTEPAAGAELPAATPAAPAGGREGADGGHAELTAALTLKHNGTNTPAAEAPGAAGSGGSVDGEVAVVDGGADPIKELPDGEVIADPELDARLTEAETATAAAEEAIAAAEQSALALMHAKQDGSDAAIEAAQDAYDTAVAQAELAIRDAEAARDRAADYARSVYGIEIGDMAGRQGYAEDVVAHNLGQRIDGLAGKLDDVRTIAGDGPFVSPEDLLRPADPDLDRPHLPPFDDGWFGRRQPGIMYV